MRANWIILVLAGVVPTCAFYLLDWTGATTSLAYISTTAWDVGHPTVWELVQMFLSVITWTWVKGFMNLFLVAALPFLVADVVRSVRTRSSAAAPKA